MVLQQYTHNIHFVTALLLHIAHTNHQPCYTHKNTHTQEHLFGEGSILSSPTGMTHDESKQHQHDVPVTAVVLDGSSVVSEVRAFFGFWFSLRTAEKTAYTQGSQQRTGSLLLYILVCIRCIICARHTACSTAKIMVKTNTWVLRVNLLVNRPGIPAVHGVIS